MARTLRLETTGGEGVEELLAALGRVPALRTMMKAAVKGGLDLTDAARDLAVVANRQWDLRVTGARRASGGDSAPAAPVIDTPAAGEPPAAAAPAPAMPRAIGESAASAGSDGHATTTAPVALTQVDGIGPGVSGVLTKAGVTTVEQLAATDVARLRDLLWHAGRPYRSMDPTPWPERARRLLTPALEGNGDANAANA
jgi:predicted flap endonuclease-1-like 5' DNA nuclease